MWAEEFEDQHYRWGRQINRLFRPSKKKVNGDGVVIQTKSSNMFAAQVDNDLNADFPAARSFGVQSYTIRLSEDPLLNDLRRVSIGLQLTHLDLKRVYTKEVSPVDFTEEQISQAKADVMERIAINRYLPQTGLIGTISGTPKRNNAKTMTDASALTTTGGARFQLSGASLAIFQRGRLIDVYTGTTKRFTVYVTDYNPQDGSVGVYGLDGNGSPSSSVNISTIAANDSLYFVNGYNKGLRSMGHWFSTPTSGESFFGRDRTDADFRWLDIHRSGPATASKFSPSYFDTLATEMAYISEDGEDATLCVTTPEIEQTFRQSVGNDLFVQYPSAEQRGKLIASYGFDGMLYRHPRLGRMNVNVDALCPPNRIRGFGIGDWKTYFPAGYETFEWLDGEMGIWYRMQSSTPGAGKTTTYRADGMVALCDVCFRPRRQWEISNVTG